MTLGKITLTNDEINEYNRLKKKSGMPEQGWKSRCTRSRQSKSLKEGVFVTSASSSRISRKSKASRKKANLR